MERFILLIKKAFKYLLGKKESTFLNHGKRFYSNSLIDNLFPNLVVIGDNFISAPGSIILAHDASFFLFTQKYRIAETVIGNNVFLGANSVILPGIKICDNVIIGSLSVVTKSIDKSGVYAGNPAKFICTIEESCSKQENRNCLYSPPLEFVKAYKDQNLNINVKNKFKSKIEKEFKDAINIK